MSSAKVVGIRGGVHAADDHQAKQKPLSAPLIKLRDSMKSKVHSLLRTLFDNADDALFTLADKAGSNGDQALYFDAMRELRLQKKHIATNVLKGLIESFNELGNIEPDTKEAGLRCDNLDDVSLVDNDDLEMKVAVEGMVSRIRGNCGAVLDDLAERVRFLMGVSGSIGAANSELAPASPEVLCESFVDACSELDVGIRARLVVLKLFEKYVLAEMIQVYAEANQLLVQQGVIPEMKKYRMGLKQRGAPQLSSNTKGNQPAEDSAAASNYLSDEDVVPTLTEASYYQGDQHYAAPRFEELRNLMHQGEAGVGGQNAEPPTLSEAFYSQGELVGALSKVQGSDIALVSQSTGRALIDFRALLDQNLAGDSCTANYSEMDSDVINLVSMLFEFILDDRQLQPTMKALIARLQIPILKVAIMDRNFFNKGGHPARKLLNEIASAAIGWNEVAEGKVDRLKDKISGIVDTVLNDFDNDLELFAELQQEFSAFMDVEKRRGQLVEQRTKDCEKGKAASELAKAAVEQKLNQVLAKRSVPQGVIELLREGWSNYMVLHYLKGGEQGLEWSKACALVDELVWTVDPDRDDDSARDQLIGLIPGVMTGLRAGLKEVSFDEFRTRDLLKQIEVYHVAVLQQLQVSQELPVEDESVASAVVDQAMHEEQDQAIADLIESTLELEADFAALEQKQSQAIAEAPAQTKDETSAAVEAKSEVAAESRVDDEHVEEIVLASPDTAAVEVDENDPFVQQVSRFSVGCWFEFHNEGRSERCKLAAVIKATGKYIFVNRSGVKVAEKSKMGLAIELRRGSLQVLNDGLLFDRALESIITNLRGKDVEL